jgi:hypothetical protein
MNELQDSGGIALRWSHPMRKPQKTRQALLCECHGWLAHPFSSLLAEPNSVRDFIAL